MQTISVLLEKFDNALRSSTIGLTHRIRNLSNGPLTGALTQFVIWGVGAFVLIKALLTAINRGAYRIEKILVVIATLLMTALVFNVYLMEQKTALTSSNDTSTVQVETTNDVPVHPPQQDSTPPGKQAELTGPVEVLLIGNATDVQLVRGNDVFTLPGTIERGHYSVKARFDGWDERGEAGAVTFTGPGPISLKCDSFAETCRIKKIKKPIIPKVKREDPSPFPGEGTPEGLIRVEMEGSATDVQLISEHGTYDVPNTLKMGEYSVLARFDGWDERGDAGKVTISGSKTVLLKCDSFAETCRIKKNKSRPAFMDKRPTELVVPKPQTTSTHPVSVSVKGGGTEHELHALGQVFKLPSNVPPGQYIIQAQFPDIGKTTAGSLLIPTELDSISIYCEEKTWQCVEDSNWWNIWGGEGQINLALMLMVAMGFLGASIATVEGKHLAVDATERILSMGPARLVKRFTSLVAAGLCFILMVASWDKIVDPESGGSTFPGAKVWWWMVKPINSVTTWLPGDKYGPGTIFKGRSNWEDALIEQGQEWPFDLAYSYVQQGDGFPLWIPLLFLVAAFGIMGIRFSGQVLSPPVAQQPTKQGTRRPADILFAGAFPGVLIALVLSVWFGKGFMIIVAAILLVIMGSPLFIAVGVATLAGWLLLKDASATTIVSDMFEATKKQEIIAIPFFVLAGNIMTNGSIAKRLIGFTQALVGPLPGGLGVSAVFACAVFAAISGSSPATVIAIGSVMFPMLVKQGYSEKFSLGLLSTSGSLGIIIPPSVPMIIYAVMVSNPSGPVGILSPTELFLGGVAPGFFIAAALVFYTLYVNWPRPDQTSAVGSNYNAVESLPWLVSPKPSIAEGQPPTRYFPNLFHAFVRGIPSLLLPVLVLGGIYGWFSIIGLPIAFDVTQAAAIAVVYALFVELFIHRELKVNEVAGVCIETASMIGSLFLILVIAMSLNKLLVLLEVPQYATETMLQYTTSPLTFLIAVNIFLLLLGCVMDIISAILIVAPLLAPIAAQYGIHPIHFGIMFIVNLELGYLTPPMGINLFVASTTFERPLLKVIKSIMPFLLVMLFCLFCVIWIPRWFQSTTCVQIPGLPAFTEQYLEDNKLCQP